MWNISYEMLCSRSERGGSARGDIRWESFPHVGSSLHGRVWLQIQANLQLAPKTIEAYGCALDGFLRFCSERRVAPETVNREDVGAYVRHLAQQPNPRGAKIRRMDSAAGLANSTLQLRLTAVRLFYVPHSAVC
jgi:hypothetical protein